MGSALSDYAALAPHVIKAHAHLSDDDIFRPVAAYLPTAPGTVLDIGAGIGRTAAWLSRQGIDVTAAEPVPALRTAGQARCRHLSIRWIDDSLPRLKRTRALGAAFDCVILCGVWHHLPPDQRAGAMRNIRHLIGARGRVLISLRHGPTPSGLTSYPVNPGDTIAQAQSHGLEKEFEATVPAVQSRNRARGVTWTWVSLRPD